jgi:hypothetical protein
VDCEVGRPKVNYRETIQARAEFMYLHKKQSGGSGAALSCLLSHNAVLWYVVNLPVCRTQQQLVGKTLLSPRQLHAARQHVISSMMH